MPCEQGHDHQWPTSGVHELVVQPCEKQCGWCDYGTEHANNLRVHARRHIANSKDDNLKGITVAKCKAGRTRTEMASTGSRKRRRDASVDENYELSEGEEDPIERQNRYVKQLEDENNHCAILFEDLTTDMEKRYRDFTSKWQSEREEMVRAHAHEREVMARAHNLECEDLRNKIDFLAKKMHMNILENLPKV